MKRALVGVLVVFTVLEVWLATRCMTVHRSLVEGIVSSLAEPGTQMMLVDFSLFAVMVSAWLILDAKKRGKSGWLWMPLMALFPTVALAVYLLARGSTSAAAFTKDA